MSTPPPGPPGRKHETLAERARHELVQYLIISAYLYVCFGAILLYKAAILHSEGIQFAPFGVAIVKALILGKFILIGLALKVGERETPSRLLLDIISKSLAFLLLLVVLSIVEEICVGLLHGRAVHDAFAGVAGGTLPEALATSLLLLLILIPYFAFREIAHGLGEGELMRLLAARRPPPAPAPPTYYG
jgi:Na+-transporting NADH:ubiquinone oxidoreductase subunit NqrD